MQARYVVLTIIVMLMLCCLVPPVPAAQSMGTAVVSSNPGEGISLTVRGTVSNWTLNIGDNVDSTDLNMTVSSNDDWIVYARDALDGGKDSHTAGNMSEFDPLAGTYVSGGYNMTNPLNVRSSGQYVSLNGANQQIESGIFTPANGNTYNLSVKQNVLFADPRCYNSHFYRMVVTFVGVNT